MPQIVNAVKKGDNNKIRIKVIIDKSRGEQFFMEQKLRFGLVLGRLAILKKKLGADYKQLLRVVFSGAKKDFLKKLF